MILQSLYNCYDLLEKDENYIVPPKGYSFVICSYALVINAQGLVESVTPLGDEKSGQKLMVPAQSGRTGKNPTPYFLCDKSKYILGAEIPNGKKDLEQTPDSLRNCITRHREILEGVEDDGAHAVLAFFQRMEEGYQPVEDSEHAVYKGGNIVFRYDPNSLDGDEEYVHEIPGVRKAWEREEERKAEEEAYYSSCLISGASRAPIARTHTMFKGVIGSNTTGAGLVGFNFKSVESYGKVQSYNAPVSEDAMFRYTAALQALLNDRRNTVRFGDVTCVFWGAIRYALEM